MRHLKKYRLLFLIVASLFTVLSVFPQTTASWTGATSTSWTTASNWSGGAVPTSSTDVTIGDASFTGSSQPYLNSTVTIKSLNIGSGSKASTLSLGNKGVLSVNGDITIGSNGTFVNKKVLTLTGNFIADNNFTATNNTTVVFAGANQTISGSAATCAFDKLTINAGCTLTLGRNIAVGGTYTVNGTLDPGLYTTSGNPRFNSGSIVYIATSTRAGNLSGTPSFQAGSTAYYSATSITQTIAAGTYSNLIITNPNTCTLAGAVSINTGNVSVEAGTLDLSSYTLNRTAAGGTFTLTAGTSMKLGGTFPSNFLTFSIDPTSTINYNGAAQTISPRTYGNLVLSGSGAKTSTGTIAVSGNLVSSGTITFSPGANVTVDGIDSIGTGTTFNGGSYSHSFGGDIVNSGTISGGTSTITLSGDNASFSGSGGTTFNNLTVSGSGVTAGSSTNLTIAGNLQTTGAGTFEHLSGGSGITTFSGTSKTISGSSITLNNVTIGSGASISTSTNLTINGNLTATGTFSASGGSIFFNGSSKTIDGAGALTFATLEIQGSISTSRSFTINTGLNVAGSLTASAGTITFTGTSTVAGSPNLFNVTLNGTSLKLGSGSTLGIAGVLTLTAGSFDVTTATPNTVAYNSAGAQNVTTTTYHNLVLKNGNTKSAVGVLTINGNLSIESSTTFNAGSWTHLLYGSFSNAGVFTASTITITMTGSLDATITGSSTFNALTINKSSALAAITLQNNIVVSSVTMTSGKILTDTNSITITSESGRTGNGLIIGTITRTHSFSSSAYAFEGPYNTIAFTSGSGNISSVTVKSSLKSITDFTFGSAINREYNITVTGTSYTATLLLHYENNELNGNTEQGLELWHYGTSWATQGKTNNDSTNNWVELTGVADISGRWTLSEFVKTVRWTGSISSAWENENNWVVLEGSPSLPPSSTDLVRIGDSLFTNQPTINSAATARAVVFGSAQAATLTIASGSLTTSGNISGDWSVSRTHAISVGGQSLTIGGDLSLGDGTAGHVIDLSIGTGAVSISGSLTHTSNSTFTLGSGTLSIGTNYSYVSGTFNRGTGTVKYNGTDNQTIAGVTYYNLEIDKSGGTATLSVTTTITNNLVIKSVAMTTGANILVSGDLTIQSGGTLNAATSTISVGGNWINSGTFIGGTSTVNLNGGGSQSISATAFNNLTINKGAGIATPSGNLSIAGNLTLSAGQLNLSTYTADRTASGGTFTLGAGTYLYVSGADNFPANFTTNTISATSTVEYNSAIAQTVAAKTYGHLLLSNGGSNAKTLAGNATVAGNTTISSGSTFDASSALLIIQGNWINNGTFTPSTSTVQFSGSSKTITGTTSFKNLSVTGSCTASSDITIAGSFTNSGTFATGSTTLTFSGDMANNGTLANSGNIVFSGTGSQSIAMNSGFSSTGTVQFNGTVTPTFAGLSSPTFQNLTINNTGGITPTTDWTIGGTFTVNSGGIFNGSGLTHTFSGAFTNNGSINSDGRIKFTPSSSATLALTGTWFNSKGTLEFGGSGLITLAAGVPDTITNVTVSNSNGSGLTLVSGWTIRGDLVVQSGATMHAGTGLAHTFAGNMSVTGTFEGGTATITFDNTTNRNVSISSASAFYNLTVASSDSVTVTTNISISKNLANNGKLINDGIIITLAGSSSASIGGSTTPFPIAQLAISKTSATVTLGVNISNVTDLSILSGVFDLGSYTVERNTTDGGSASIANGAQLKIGGTSNLTFDTLTCSATSTVEYNGSGVDQTIFKKTTYGNLSITASGNKTIDSALTVAGNFTLSSGTFKTSASSTTHKIAGNWTLSGGTFDTANAPIIQFNGTGNQTISSTVSFCRLTINKSTGNVVLSTDITVGTLLTFTSGKIITNSYKVILGQYGSTSRISGHVVGNLQKYVRTGSNIPRTFEIGDTTTYSPDSLTFTSVTTAGNLIASVASGDHTDIINSGVNPSKSVNRNWTLTNSGIVFTTYSITFTFVSGDLDGTADYSRFNISKKESGSWSVQTTGTRTSTTTQATGVTGFGDFQIGESGKTWDGGAGTQNWGDANNWNPNGIPGSVDAISLGNADTIIVNVAGACDDLTMSNAALLLSITSGYSLTVSGGLSIANGNLTTNAAFPSVSGTTSITGGTIVYGGTSAQSVVALTYNNLSFTGARGSNSITFPGSTITITGALTNQATFSGGSFVMTGNTIIYNTTSAQTIGSFNYNNLTVNGTRSGNVTLDPSGTIGIAGTFTPSATFSSGGWVNTSSTVEFNGSGAQSIPTFSFNNLTISGNRGSSAITLPADTMKIAGTFSPTATAVSYSQTGTIFEFNGNGAQTIPSFTYNSLVFSNSGTKTISSSINSDIDFINKTGSSVAIGSGATVQINGNLNNAGTVTNDGTIITGTP